MVLYFVEFTLVYFPHKAVTRQALANFLANHPSLEIKSENDVQLWIYVIERRPWVLNIDASSTEKFVGARIVIISPKGIKTNMRLQFGLQMHQQSS